MNYHFEPMDPRKIIEREWPSETTGLTVRDAERDGRDVRIHTRSRGPQPRKLDQRLKSDAQHWADEAKYNRDSMLIAAGTVMCLVASMIVAAILWVWPWAWHAWFGR